MTFNMSPVVFKICAVALLTQLRISPGYAQSDSIVFAGTATTVATTQTPTTRASSNCRCVTAGTCGSAGVDVRIVNQGAAGCPYGQEWCCGSTTAPPTPPPPSTSCGIRKITNSAAQPEGTAKYGAYPWQAALLTESNAYIGSGVLISPDYVLTAAHKTAMYPNRNFIVRLGEWDGQKTNEPNAYQDYTPAQVITHPNYNSGNYQNDISIIRLNKSVPIASSPNINTACLASAVPAAGTRCWVSGWGKNAFGSSGSYQSIMREVDVPIIDQADCESRLRNTRLGQYFVLDRTSYMCAGGEAGKDACTGDGGAPLVCQQSNGQWQVVGLVTWGIGCASSGVPGVYVNVPNYRSWITQLTGVSR
ncbi:phenoloxidase-activating factor 2-like [Venturia canescens]|uniref:phenoloxidase-activating factor 2-like n=1 Tax=Venturia canescens TaxID=32260 RepID=UPI001C9D4C0B|nr:phenoloxidase-activating factor 2-like [Venturia canescens]